jgi:hypothetical protein
MREQMLLDEIGVNESDEDKTEKENLDQYNQD